MSKGLKERVEEIKSLLYHEHYITGGYIDSLDVLALTFLRWHDKRIEQEKVKAKLFQMNKMKKSFRSEQEVWYEEVAGLIQSQLKESEGKNWNCFL